MRCDAGDEDPSLLDLGMRAWIAASELCLHADSEQIPLLHVPEIVH